MIQKKPYDYKIDIWGLGILLFELIQGYAPFRGETGEEVIAEMKKPLIFSNRFGTHVIIKILCRSTSSRRSWESTQKTDYRSVKSSNIPISKTQKKNSPRNSLRQNNAKNPQSRKSLGSPRISGNSRKRFQPSPLNYRPLMWPKGRRERGSLIFCRGRASPRKTSRSVKNYKKQQRR